MADADGAPGGGATELRTATPGPRTRIRLCGPLALEIDGHDLAPGLPGGQAAALVGRLLADPQHAADRDELIDLLWPARPPRDPQAALRPVLSRIRRAIAPAVLEGRERLRLALPEPVWIDADSADHAVRAARAAARSGAWRRAREHAEHALELVGPGFLPAAEGDWAAARRQELEELALEALEWIARSGPALGGADLAAAERAGRELVARAPFRETGYRFLMETLAAAGNAAEALRVYEDLRVLLRDELGAAPAAEVQAVHGRLLAAEAAAPPAPAAAPPAAASPEPARVPLPALLSPREHAPFVAREAELARLRAAWADARAGRRRLVVLVGEPGIGKTRLTSELAVEAHAEGTVLYAACRQEALVSYQPFADALRHYARSTDLGWAVPQLGPGAAELARLVPELADALPAGADAAPADPETRRYLMFEAVSALLGAASARSPLLLVLDDLHWADHATLHLLRHVARAAQDASLLVVGTYRAAEVAGGHPLADVLADLRRDRLFERIALEGLDEREVGTLISSLAGHPAPGGLVGAVHQHTEGNPFFVEEVMRHLIETGVLFERGGRWVSALTPDEIGVPDGVREVLARRLEHLSAPCRAVLARAAVLGRECTFDVLRATVDVGEDELIDALEEAVAAQLVVEGQGRSGPVYAFTHALVREVLVTALSAPRRQRIHARAAAALEAVERDAQLASIAGHLRRAGSAADPERALAASLRAGMQAREVFAWDEAAAHWDGAAEVMARTGDRPAQRTALLVHLADLMALSGDLGRQIGHLERALALAQERGDDEAAAQAHSRLGMALSLIDSIFAEHLDLHRAFAHFDAAREVLDRGPVRRSRGHLETGVATALTYGLRIPEGIATARRGMAIAEELGDEVLWAGAAEACAWHSIVAGNIAEGLALLDRACAVAEREQRPFLAWMGWNMRGQLTWGLGAPDEAQAAFERPLELAYVGKSAYRRQVADGLGRCHVSRGELDAARRLLSDARPTWITHSLKPLVDLRDGRLREVAALAERVLATSRRTGNRWDEWAAQHLAARVASLEGDHASAAALLERALVIVTDGGAPYFELWVRPDLACALVAEGRVAEAREHADRCAAIVAGGEDWRGRAAHVALADAVVLDAEGRADAADARFAAARDIAARYRLAGDEEEIGQRRDRAERRRASSAPRPSQSGR